MTRLILIFATIGLSCVTYQHRYNRLVVSIVFVTGVVIMAAAVIAYLNLPEPVMIIKVAPRSLEL